MYMNICECCSEYSHNLFALYYVLIATHRYVSKTDMD